MDHLLCILIDILAELSRFSRPLARLGIGSFDAYRPGGKLKILLAGYNGARNTGSDVRVASIAKQVRELFGDECEITVMALDRDSISSYFDEDVRLFDFTTLYPFALFRACSENHAAILCEGSTLKSTFANALTLFLCEASAVMNGQGKPCIAYGSEVGTMEPFLEKAASRLCRNTHFITRTQDSLDRLRRLGLKGHAGTDAAWSYDGAISAEEADRLLREQGWDGEKPLLGIAVIDPFCWPVRASLARWIRTLISGNHASQYDKWYYYSESAERTEKFEKYIDGIAEGADRFISEQGFFPVILGMERLDEKACRALRAKLPHHAAMLLSGDTTADVMTGVLRRLSALVTSRYHASVLSMEKGCPIVAVSMDERLSGIMKELSLDDKYLLHVSDGDLGRKVHDALAEGYAQREQIEKHIAEMLPEYKDKLSRMGAFMKEYITGALRH